MINFLASPRFPDAIGFHSSRSAQFYTEVVALQNGFEQRNARWSSPLHRYDVASGIKTETDLSTMLHFFNNVRGRWIGFRFKDWLDYSSAPVLGKPLTALDQAIGTGDGENKAFSLLKTYRAGGLSQTRRIQKPVEATVRVAVNGTLDPRFTVDLETGVVTLPEDVEPPPLGSRITAGFEFDVPCRFDSDQLCIGLQFQNVGSFSVPLVEVRFNM